MTRKSKVAEFIRSSKKTRSYKEWIEFQKQIPEIRLKKAAQSKTLINLDGESGFIDPESWLSNYEAGQKVYLRRALVQAKEALSEEDMELVLDELGYSHSQDQFENGFLTCWSKLSRRVLYLMDEIHNKNPEREESKLGAYFFVYFRLLLYEIYDDEYVNSLHFDELVAKIKEEAQAD